jgi:NAD(P)-dependent dehydrogenase (short-subunit alcohol dehydrogenase family)
MNTFEGRVALVAGAASGIGLALARRFADAGHASLPLAGAGSRTGRFFQFLDRRKAGLDPFLERARLDPLADADRLEARDDFLFFLGLVHGYMKSVANGAP